MPRSLYEFPEPPCDFALPYPAERLAWCLEVIGWSNNEAARRLAMHEEDFRRMLRGRRFIPEIVAYWFEMLAGVHLQFSKPIGWGVLPPPMPVELVKGQESLGVYPSYRIALQAAREEALLDERGMLLPGSKIRAVFTNPSSQGQSDDDE